MTAEGIGEKIRNLREKEKMTQKQLGDFLGYSESYISYIEKETRPISLADLKKLTTLFKVDPNFFLQTNALQTHFRVKKSGPEIDFEKMLNDFDEFAGKGL